MSTQEAQAEAGIADVEKEESPFADEKDGDPGLKFLKEINLTPSEEEELATLARGWIPGRGVLRSDDGKIICIVMADSNHFRFVVLGNKSPLEGTMYRLVRV